MKVSLPTFFSKKASKKFLCLLSFQRKQVGSFFAYFLFKESRLVGVVVEVTLNENDGSTLVARAACQVAKRTDKVGELTGSSSL